MQALDSETEEGQDDIADHKSFSEDLATKRCRPDNMKVRYRASIASADILVRLALCLCRLLTLRLKRDRMTSLTTRAFLKTRQQDVVGQTEELF